jgi:hypothetical protein
VSYSPYLGLDIMDWHGMPAGKLYFHHFCGLIRDLLPLYRRTRMDAMHAFTVPPIGNVIVAEGRRILGDRIAIITRVNHTQLAADSCRESGDTPIIDPVPQLGKACK